MTLCDPMDCSLPGSSVHGIFQARILEWVVISSKGSKHRKIPEYGGGLPFPSPGGLPNPGIKLGSPALQADFLPSEPPGKSIEYSGEVNRIQWEFITFNPTQ